MKISNPSVGNVISGDDPVAIAIGDAAAAGAGGEVSDEAHRHPVLDTQFMRLLGEQLTEGSTTSTTPVDLISITGLTIPVTQPLLICGNVRKTAGAAVAAVLGLTLNAIIVQEAAVSTFTLWRTVSADQVDDGAFMIYLGPRDGVYTRPGARMGGTIGTTGPSSAWSLQTADFPNAEITDIIIRGDANSALVTLAVDNLRVYGLPTT